jgi:hypothetical protein
MVGLMVFNVTFNYISVISWRPVLVVEESGVPERTIDYGKQLVNFITLKVALDTINQIKSKLNLKLFLIDL